MSGSRSNHLRRLVVGAWGAALCLGALGGCAEDGGLPGAPTAAGPPVTLTGATTLEPAEPVTENPRPGLVPVVVSLDAVSSTVLIKAAQGGVVTAGRHRLIVPPGALKVDTEITLRDISSDNGYVTCEALPEGLQFQAPAWLETRFGDVIDPHGFTIYWVADPGTPAETWIELPARYTSDGQGLAVRLNHFSTYAPGKAGWGPVRGRGSKDVGENGRY